MTYVLGRKFGKTAAIISDSLVTKQQDRFYQDQFGLKSGILFTDCIYGGAGCVESLTDFILHCRDITERADNPWHAFVEAAKGYHFPSRISRFDMLLSSRHEGVPQLFLLQSDNPVLQPVGERFSIGCGKNLIDPNIDGLEDHGSVFNPQRYIQQGVLPERDFPFLYCFFLTSWAQGYEVNNLLDVSVGGYFTFVRQTPDGESWQEPAVVLMSHGDKEKLEIRVWAYRISISDGIVDLYRNINEPERCTFTAKHVRPDLFADASKLDVTLAELDRQRLSQEPYRLLFVCPQNPGELLKPLVLIFYPFGETYNFDHKTGECDKLIWRLLELYYEDRIDLVNEWAVENGLVSCGT